jgi:hypothetical protein
MLKSGDKVLISEGYIGIYEEYCYKGHCIWVPDMQVHIYLDQEPQKLSRLADAVHADKPDITYFQPPPPTAPDPSLEEVMEWVEEDGGCEATDGCWVEPDGTCEHGCPSWLLKWGLI